MNTHKETHIQKKISEKSTNGKAAKKEKVVHKCPFIDQTEVKTIAEIL